jgi:hypothetical protein
MSIFHPEVYPMYREPLPDVEVMHEQEPFEEEESPIKVDS